MTKRITLAHETSISRRPSRDHIGPRSKGFTLASLSSSPATRICWPRRVSSGQRHASGRDRGHRLPPIISRRSHLQGVTRSWANCVRSFRRSRLTPRTRSCWRSTELSCWTKSSTWRGPRRTLPRQRGRQRADRSYRAPASRGRSPYVVTASPSRRGDPNGVF